MLLSIGAFAQDGGYTITGKISGHDNEKVFLQISVSAFKTTSDSTVITNGQFVFKGKLPEPAPVSLKLSSDYEGRYIFLDNVALNVDAGSGTLLSAKITGSKENDLYTIFDAQIQPYLLTDDDVTKYGSYQAENDTANLKKTQALFDDKEARRLAITTKFAAEHPDAKVSAYMLIVYLSDAPYQQLLDAYQPLTERIKNSGYGKYLQKRLGKLQKTAPGHLAEDFVENDMNGKPVHLSSFKGKYVLLDFWASWCVPCRQANPHLVSLYQKYNNKGLDMISIAFEQPNGKDGWLKAVAEDKLSWTNLSDLNYFNNAAAVQYGVTNIPANLLLDPEGRVIGKNLSADELDKKLAGLFN